MSETTVPEEVDALLTAMAACASPNWAAQKVATRAVEGRRSWVLNFGADMNLARATELVDRGAAYDGSMVAPSYSWLVPAAAEPTFVALAIALGVALGWDTDANGNRRANWGPGPRGAVSRNVG